VVGTYKGYMISHDLRANSCTNLRRLMLDKKHLPILGVSQFQPQSRFRHIGIKDELVSLIYPSNNNEFSVFRSNDFSSKMIPKIHFYSSKEESRTSAPLLIPHLEDVTSTELYIDYDTQCQGKYSLFQDWVLDDNCIFRLGRSFEVRTVDTIVSLYTEPFHNNILGVKQQWISEFEKAMKTLSTLSDYKNTTYKLVNLPTQVFRSPSTQVDNVILTGGTDRNLRFLNFGNGYSSTNSHHESIDKEQGNLTCFHLANTDNNPRKYKYTYSGDSLLVKEEIGSPTDSFPVIEDMTASYTNLKNGLSFYHNSFLYKKKTAHTLPGHTAAIRDIITVESENDILVITAGDDHAIKIWN
jgi:hypothetical protein